MENKLLQNKKFLLALLILFSALLVIIFYFIFYSPQSNILIIDNLDKQIQGLPTYRKEELQKLLYSYINEQNKINDVKNEDVYHGSIRDNSTETTSSNITTTVYSTSFILDITKLQYSYEVQFSWVKESSTEDIDVGIDLGSASIYCLSEEDSIYPDFNCNKNPMVSTKADPLLSTNMVISKDCWMSPFSSVESKSGYGINIFYHPVDDDYKNNTIESSYNACVETAKQSLTSNGLNLNNYKIKSEIKYLYNY